MPNAECQMPNASPSECARLLPPPVITGPTAEPARAAVQRLDSVTTPNPTCPAPKAPRGRSMSIAASNPSDASLAAPHADERELFSLLGLSHPDLQRNDKVSIDASGSVWSVVFATTDTVTVTTGDVTRRVPVSDVLLLAKAARVDTATDATKSNAMRAGRAASARAPTSGAALQVVGTDSSSQQQAAPRRSTSTPLARCTCNGREDGRQGRHRIACPRSRSFSANSRRVPLPGSIAEARGITNFEGTEDASDPTTTTAEESAPPLGCPSFEAVAALKVGLVSFIPESARADVAAALAFTLNAVRAVPRKWAWVRLLAFAPCAGPSRPR